MADRPAVSTTAPEAMTTPTGTPPAAGGTARTIVLLGLLAVLIGWYSYDYFIAKPATLATDSAAKKRPAAAKPATGEPAEKTVRLWRPRRKPG